MVFKKQIWVLGKNKKVHVFPSFFSISPAILKPMNLKKNQHHELIENSQFQTNSTRPILLSFILLFYFISFCHAEQQVGS